MYITQAVKCDVCHNIFFSFHIQVLLIKLFKLAKMSSSDEIVVALYDYSAKEQEELSIKKNEQLVLLDAKFTWWKVSSVMYSWFLKIFS